MDMETTSTLQSTSSTPVTQSVRCDLSVYYQDLLTAEEFFYRRVDGLYDDLSNRKNKPPASPKCREEIESEGMQLLRQSNCISDIYKYFKMFEAYKCCTVLVGGMDMLSYSVRIASEDSDDVPMTSESPYSPYESFRRVEHAQLTEEELRSYKKAILCAKYPVLTDTHCAVLDSGMSSVSPESTAEDPQQDSYQRVRQSANSERVTRRRRSTRRRSTALSSSSEETHIVAESGLTNTDSVALHRSDVSSDKELEHDRDAHSKLENSEMKQIIRSTEKIDKELSHDRKDVISPNQPITQTRGDDKRTVGREEFSLISADVLSGTINGAFGIPVSEVTNFLKLVFSQTQKKKEDVLVAEDLMYQLSLLEMGLHPKYNRTGYVSSDGYEEWVRTTRERVLNLLGKFWKDRPFPSIHSREVFSVGSIHDDYDLLLCKLFWYEDCGIQRQRRQKKGGLLIKLSPMAQRCLTEFSLRYGIGEMYQRLAVLKYLVSRFQLARTYLDYVLSQINEIIRANRRVNMLLKSERSELKKCTVILLDNCKLSLINFHTRYKEPQLDHGCYVDDIVKAENSIKDDRKETLKSLVKLIVGTIELFSFVKTDESHVVVAGILTSFCNEHFSLVYQEHSHQISQRLETEQSTSSINQQPQKQTSNRYKQQEQSRDSKVLQAARKINCLISSLRNEICHCASTYEPAFKNYINDVTSLAAQVFYSRLITEIGAILTSSHTCASRIDFGLVALIYRLNTLDQDWSCYLQPNGSRKSWRTFYHARLANWWLVIQKEAKELLLKSLSLDKFEYLKIMPCPVATTDYQTRYCSPKNIYMATEDQRVASGTHELTTSLTRSLNSAFNQVEPRRWCSGLIPSENNLMDDSVGCTVSGVSTDVRYKPMSATTGLDALLESSSSDAGNSAITVVADVHAAMSSVTSNGSNKILNVTADMSDHRENVTESNPGSSNGQNDINSCSHVDPIKDSKSLEEDIVADENSKEVSSDNSTPVVAFSPDDIAFIDDTTFIDDTDVNGITATDDITSVSESIVNVPVRTNPSNASTSNGNAMKPDFCESEAKDILNGKEFQNGTAVLEGMAVSDVSSVTETKDDSKEKILFSRSNSISFVNADIGGSNCKSTFMSSEVNSEVTSHHMIENDEIKTEEHNSGVSKSVNVPLKTNKIVRGDSVVLASFDDGHDDAIICVQKKAEHVFTAAEGNVNANGHQQGVVISLVDNVQDMEQQVFNGVSTVCIEFSCNDECKTSEVKRTIESEHQPPSASALSNMAGVKDPLDTTKVTNGHPSLTVPICERQEADCKCNNDSLKVNIESSDILIQNDSTVCMNGTQEDNANGDCKHVDLRWSSRHSSQSDEVFLNEDRPLEEQKKESIGDLDGPVNVMVTKSFVDLISLMQRIVHVSDLLISGLYPEYTNTSKHPDGILTVETHFSHSVTGGCNMSGSDLKVSSSDMLSANVASANTVCSVTGSSDCPLRNDAGASFTTPDATTAAAGYTNTAATNTVASTAVNGAHSFPVCIISSPPVTGTSSHNSGVSSESCILLSSVSASVNTKINSNDTTNMTQNISSASQSATTSHSVERDVSTGVLTVATEHVSTTVLCMSGSPLACSTSDVSWSPSSPVISFDQPTLWTDPDNHSSQYTNILDQRKTTPSSLKNQIKKLLGGLVLIYAKNMLFMDLCGLEDTVTKGLTGSDEIMEEIQTDRNRPCVVWGCRHKVNNVDCFKYNNHKAVFIGQQFEPITSDMCARITALNELWTISKQMFQKLREATRFTDLSRSCSRDSQEANRLASQTSAGDNNEREERLGEVRLGSETAYDDWLLQYISASRLTLINILAYRINLFIEASLKRLLDPDVAGRGKLDHGLDLVVRFLRGRLQLLEATMKENDHLDAVKRLWISIVKDIEGLVRGQVNVVVGLMLGRSLDIQQIIVVLLSFFCNKFQKLISEDVFINRASDVMYWLQLYSLPTRSLIDICDIVLQRPNQSGKEDFIVNSTFLGDITDGSMSNLVVDLNPGHCADRIKSMQQELHRKCKSFTGQVLLDWMRSHACSNVGDELEQIDEMLRIGILVEVSPSSRPSGVNYPPTTKCESGGVEASSENPKSLALGLTVEAGNQITEYDVAEDKNQSTTDTLSTNQAVMECNANDVIDDVSIATANKATADNATIAVDANTRTTNATALAYANSTAANDDVTSIANYTIANDDATSVTNCTTDNDDRTSVSNITVANDDATSIANSAAANDDTTSIANSTASDTSVANANSSAVSTTAANGITVDASAAASTVNGAASDSDAAAKCTADTTLISVSAADDIVGVISTTEAINAATDAAPVEIQNQDDMTYKAVNVADLMAASVARNSTTTVTSISTIPCRVDITNTDTSSAVCLSDAAGTSSALDHTSDTCSCNDETESKEKVNAVEIKEEVDLAENKENVAPVEVRIEDNMTFNGLRGEYVRSISSDWIHSPSSQFGSTIFMSDLESSTTSVPRFSPSAKYRLLNFDEGVDETSLPPESSMQKTGDLYSRASLTRSELSDNNLHFSSPCAYQAVARANRLSSDNITESRTASQGPTRNPSRRDHYSSEGTNIPRMSVPRPGPDTSTLTDSEAARVSIRLSHRRKAAWAYYKSRGLDAGLILAPLAARCHSLPRGNDAECYLRLLPPNIKKQFPFVKDAMKLSLLDCLLS